MDRGICWRVQNGVSAWHLLRWLLLGLDGVALCRRRDELDLDDDLDLGADLDLGDDLLADLGEDSADDLSEEMATKLELADAYIEMGDVRGAKELIEEIQADGNDDQKAAADKMAERIEGLI